MQTNRGDAGNPQQRSSSSLGLLSCRCSGKAPTTLSLEKGLPGDLAP